MIRTKPPIGSFARAAAPLLVALLGCSGSIGGTSGTSGDGAGSSSGMSGGRASGGTGNTAAGARTSTSGGTGGTSLGTAGSGGGEEPVSGQPRPVSMEGTPIYSRFVRLTNSQWENAVTDILNLASPSGLSDGFLDPVSGISDFDNNERVVIVDNTIWADFQQAAETVANQVTASDAALQAVVTGTDPENFIRTFGRRAFRRDLSDAEVTTYLGIHTDGSTTTVGTQSAYTKGVSWVIAAMLQSPHFLYRVEMGDDGAPLSGFEMATKLSLWLRDTTPSDELLDAASSLASADGALRQAEAMLAEESTVTVMRKFHGDLYKLALFDTISKDNVPGYTPALNADFKEASFQFFDRIFAQDLGVRDILTSTVGFASSGMAALYDVTLRGSGIQQVNLPDRAGYYAQIPFLALWAINDEPDSIHRGVRINLDTLCADPGLPNLDLPAIPPLEQNQTNRERIAGLTGACGRVCHGEIINPIGFAFEDFDGLGQFRETDNGKPVDTSGAYPFAEGVTEFADSGELMQLIANGNQAHQCYAKKLASYATSRDIVAGEKPLVEALGTVSQQTGGSLKDVMLALVKDNAFRTHVGGAQ